MKMTLWGASAALLCACQVPRNDARDDAGEARLYEGFGGYHRTITTRVPEAQRWFDQGLQLLYGYNHDEAIRSFEEAARLDPSCAMAWWGASYAYGLHINNPAMTERQNRGGYECAQKALAALDDESPVEQALARAVAERYAWPAPEERRPLDESYAAAMEQVWRDHPSDADVGTLFAESLMTLQPWDLWTKDGQPKGRALDIVATLEGVLAFAPRHPGANHFYIHAVEASPEPAKAVVAADRLIGLVPGSGHLVHMPSHIYTRVGRYRDAADTNARAIAADEAYFARAPKPDFYSLYFVHNVHFLAYASMMEGRYEAAIEAARKLVGEIPQEFVKSYVHFADGFLATPWHVQIRFGKWEEILRESEPESWLKLSCAQWRYARGVALSALGRTTEARAELAAFLTAAEAVPADWTVGNNKAETVLALCRAMLEGELWYREGKLDEAFARLREGVAIEDELVYDEPPGWMQPVRHALGALLLAAGRAEEAAQVYHDDLARNPENGWSLIGLAAALRKLDRGAEVVEVEARLARAWTRPDVQPRSSCYCEPG